MLHRLVSFSKWVIDALSPSGSASPAQIAGLCALAATILMGGLLALAGLSVLTVGPFPWWRSVQTWAMLVPSVSLLVPCAIWWEPSVERRRRRAIRKRGRGSDLACPPWSRYDWRFRAVGIPCAIAVLFLGAELFDWIDDNVLLPNDLLQILVQTALKQAAVTPLIVVLVVLGRRESRLLRRYHGIETRCAVCLYDLSASAPVGTCPECNEPYDHTKVPRGLAGVESTES